MSLPAFATPIPALQRPLPPAALLRSEPYDDPQYLVLAVELAPSPRNGAHAGRAYA